MDFTPLTLLWFGWAAITTVFLLLMFYRSLIGMREDDQLFLNPVESRLEAEQHQIMMRVQRVTWYVKLFGYGSAALLVLNLGILVYQAIKNLFGT